MKNECIAPEDIQELIRVTKEWFENERKELAEKKLKETKIVKGRENKETEFKVDRSNTHFCSCQHSDYTGTQVSYDNDGRPTQYLGYGGRD